jgi:sterol desaturase/sphingolipid hydroxylase (fatty acid hydroxylase superfamily)
MYPLGFGAPAVLLLALLSSGITYWVAGPLVLGATALLVGLGERVIPHARAWLVDRDGDARLDRLLLFANVLVSHLSIALFWLVSARWRGLDLWPAALPLWTQCLLALVVIDLGLYVVHRASHHVGWLWRLHAVHHSARRMYWVNGQRRHLAHELLEGAPGLLVLSLLGAPPVTYAAALALVTLHLLFQHANIDTRTGALRHVFAVAELHRWHHQRDWHQVQGNYGAVFSLWDRLFGSALNTTGTAPIDVGIDEVSPSR